tara:strand:- start:68 stop:220 length:153 start_codon:yes stop_codon:yes gene_type:complete
VQLNSKNKKKAKTCSINRKKEAIEALLLLAWKKERKDRPSWLIKEINSYC